MIRVAIFICVCVVSVGGREYVVAAGPDLHGYHGPNTVCLGQTKQYLYGYIYISIQL